MQNKQQGHKPETVSVSIAESHVIRNKPIRKDFSLQQQRTKSSFELAKITIIGFFGTLAITILFLSVCDLFQIKSDNIRWAMDKFFNHSSPLVTAVTCYYFGERSKDKNI